MSIHLDPNLSRRRFLAGASALGLAAGLPPDRFIDFAAAQPAPAPLRDPNWDDLAKRLAGPLLRKGDSPYNRFAAPYNLAYDKADRKPNGIALCVNTADVVTAVNWARDNGVPLIARSGGHSYGGYSMTTGLMIDLNTMRGASWDAASNTVTVTGGVRNSDVTGFLRNPKINRTITHGRCPTVGTAGFLLGGGIGFNMRMHGVAIDHLRASEIVTADGKVLTLSTNDNADLFWACAGGGGGNFGINTSFTLATYPTAPVTVFKCNWWGDQATMASVAYQLMTMLSDAPNEFGTRFAVTAPNPVRGQREFGVNIIGQYRGGAQTVEQFFNRIIPKGSPTIRYISYWDGQDFLLDTDQPFFFHERSAFLTKPLTKQAFDLGCAQLGQWRGTDDSDPRYKDQQLYADLRFFQTGGQMNKLPSYATAFVHRDSLWLMDIGLPWTAADPAERVDANIAWQNGFFEQMWGFSNNQSYQNFVDPALADPLSAYYGSNLDNLRSVKRKYDPDNLFKFAQSIPPAVA